MNVLELLRPSVRRRTGVLAAVSVACGLLVAGPAAAAPFVPPNTDNCPQRSVPPPPVDSSEVPKPGDTAPPPLPVPNPAVGAGQLGACGVVAPAGAPPLPADISATSWQISDLNTGEVVAAKDPHGRYRPASTIKTLLALVVLRDLDMNKVVEGTAADADMEGTRVGIGPGGRYTNNQLLHGLLMESGNDIANNFATQLGGTQATVDKMNALAAQLGASDTRAVTPSGLDGPGMSTSAYDLSLILREGMKQPLFAEVVHTEHYEFPGRPADPRIPGDTDKPPFHITNDNHLLATYPGDLGGKTGFTDNARQTFVTVAQRGDRRLAVTMLKADVIPLRPPEQAARLLDYGFAIPAGQSVGTLVAPHNANAVVSASPPVRPASATTLGDRDMSDARNRIRIGVIAGGLLVIGGLGVTAWHLFTSRRRS